MLRTKTVVLIIAIATTLSVAVYLPSSSTEITRDCGVLPPPIQKEGKVHEFTSSSLGGAKSVASSRRRLRALHGTRSVVAGSLGSSSSPIRTKFGLWTPVTVVYYSGESESYGGTR